MLDPKERFRKYSLRSVFDGILYIVKTGSQWRMLTHNKKLNNFLEKCRFMRNFLWIIAEIGVFLVWKNAERHVGKKNIELH